jgi:hypothetical protein
LLQRRESPRQEFKRQTPRKSKPQKQVLNRLPVYNMQLLLKKR